MTYSSSLALTAAGTLSLDAVALALSASQSSSLCPPPASPPVAASHPRTSGGMKRCGGARDGGNTNTSATEVAASSGSGGVCRRSLSGSEGRAQYGDGGGSPMSTTGLRCSTTVATSLFYLSCLPYRGLFLFSSTAPAVIFSIGETKRWKRALGEQIRRPRVSGWSDPAVWPSRDPLRRIPSMPPARPLLTSWTPFPPRFSLIRRRGSTAPLAVALTRRPRYLRVMVHFYFDVCHWMPFIPTYITNFE